MIKYTILSLFFLNSSLYSMENATTPATNSTPIYKYETDTILQYSRGKYDSSYYECAIYNKTSNSYSILIASAELAEKPDAALLYATL